MFYVADTVEATAILQMWMWLSVAMWMWMWLSVDVDVAKFFALGLH